MQKNNSLEINMAVQENFKLHKRDTKANTVLYRNTIQLENTVKKNQIIIAKLAMMTLRTPIKCFGIALMSM